MKIVYLIQGRDDPEQAIQLANALSIDDYVVLTLNDSKWIDEAYFLFSRHRNIYLSTSTAFATLGDLSASRTWLYQLKEACEKFEFDYAINLTENVLPTKKREEIVAYLQQFEQKSVLSIHRNTDNDIELKRQVSQYYLGTNSKQFASQIKYRNRMELYARILYSLRLRRKINFTVYEGEPWFAITRPLALILSDNLSFASEHFILSWFSERFIFQTMWKKFAPELPTVNHDLASSNEETPFKLINETLDRKQVAAILSHFNSNYVAPYDYIADEIETVKKGMLDSTINYFKNMFRKNN